MKMVIMMVEKEREKMKERKWIEVRKKLKMMANSIIWVAKSLLKRINKKKIKKKTMKDKVKTKKKVK
jgi:hypothetical protein